MHTLPAIKPLALVASLVVLLAACGGGGGSSDAGSAGQTSDTTGGTTTTTTKTDVQAAQEVVAVVKAAYPTALPAIETDLAGLNAGKYDLLDLPSLLQEAVALDRDTSKAVGSFIGNIMADGQGGVTPPDPDPNGAPVHAGCMKVAYGAECIFSAKTVSVPAAVVGGYLYSHFYTTFGLNRNGANAYTWSSRSVQEGVSAPTPAVHPTTGAAVFPGAITVGTDGSVRITGDLPPAIGYTGKLGVDLTYTATTTGSRTTRALTAAGYVNQYSGAAASTLTHALTLSSGSAITRVDPTSVSSQSARTRGYPSAATFRGTVVPGGTGGATYSGTYVITAYAAPDADGKYLPASWTFSNLAVGTSGSVTGVYAKTATTQGWTFTSASNNVTMTYDPVAKSGRVMRGSVQAGTITNGVVTYTDGKTTTLGY